MLRNLVPKGENMPEAGPRMPKTRGRYVRVMNPCGNDRYAARMTTMGRERGLLLVGAPSRIQTLSRSSRKVVRPPRSNVQQWHSRPVLHFAEQLQNPMKLFLLLFLAVFCCGASVFAEKPFPPELIAGSELATEKTATSLLPEALQQSLLNQEVFSGESGKLPAELFLAKIDLNKDGAMEYLVEDPASYTGGSITYFFQKKGENYSLLGAVQGVEYLAAFVNGYPQIVALARAGGNVYVRRIYAFKNGEYQSVRGAEYQIDENDNEKYLGEEKN